MEWNSHEGAISNCRFEYQSGVVRYDDSEKSECDAKEMVEGIVRANKKQLA